MKTLTNKEAERLKIHPAANLFPMIAEAEYEQLKADVKEHGFHEPAWIWQEPGKDFAWLIDGRNRRRVAFGLGIDLPVREWDGDGSLVEFVMSLNFHRRQLSATQRAMVAAKAMPLLEAEARKRQETSRARPGEQVGKVRASVPTPTKGRAAEQAAKAAGVSRRTVQDAKKVLKKSPRKIVLAVQDGTVSVADAKRIADLPAEKQLEALRAVRAKAAKTLAEYFAKDDLEVAVKKGTARLRSARGLFDRLEGASARAVVAAIDEAIRLAGRL